MTGRQRVDRIVGAGRKRAVGLAVAAMLWFSICVSVQAQLPVDLSLILRPVILDYTGFGSARVTAYTSEKVENQGTTFDLTTYSLSLGNQAWSSDRREVLLVTNYQRWEVDTTATFPESGLGVPDNLENFNVGVGYRQVFENDVLFGGLIQIGSASDDLFASIDEAYFAGNFLTRIPRNRRDAWLVVLSIDSNRQVPVLPGFGFQHRGAIYKVILGFPFLEGTYRPRQDVSLHFSYFPPNNVDATATYSLSSEVRVSGGFEWQDTYFRRAGRTDNDTLIEYDEKRLFGRVNFDIPKGSATLKAGYAFDRRLSEGDGLSERGRNKIDIAEGIFINAGIQLLF